MTGPERVRTSAKAGDLGGARGMASRGGKAAATLEAVKFCWRKARGRAALSAMRRHDGLLTEVLGHVGELFGVFHKLWPGWKEGDP